MFINKISDISIYNKYNKIGTAPNFGNSVALERSPENGDTTEFSTKTTSPVPAAQKAEAPKKIVKAKKVSGADKLNHSKTLKKLDVIKADKLLTDDILLLLKPKDGKTFTLAQTRVIDAAFNKLVFFKEISLELSADAEKYADKVYEDMKEIFGGDEGVGKYIIESRKKDDVSVFNKLIKEFRKEHIENQAHNIFSKRLYGKPYAMLDSDEKKLVYFSLEDGDVKIDARDYKYIENAIKTDPRNELADKVYSKPYNQLSNDERKSLSELYETDPMLVSKATRTQERNEAINWVKDLIGIRMVLPTGSRAELSKVEKFIEKGIKNNTLNLTRFSNYHGSYILPYINIGKTRYWKELTGMELVENTQVRKKNGYTTTQMNIEHYLPGRKNPILVEFQLRTKPMNDIGNRQHLIYDILEGKDITKGIPQLKTYYDSTGIEKAVNEVFRNPVLESKYSDYERAYFSYLRNEETGRKLHINKPHLANYGLGEYENPLSFEYLEVIDNIANDIKEEFGKKDVKSKKDKLEYLYKLQ